MKFVNLAVFAFTAVTSFNTGRILRDLEEEAGVALRDKVDNALNKVRNFLATNSARGGIYIDDGNYCDRGGYGNPTHIKDHFAPCWKRNPQKTQWDCFEYLPNQPQTCPTGTFDHSKIPLPATKRAYPANVCYDESRLDNPCNPKQKTCGACWKQPIPGLVGLDGQPIWACYNLRADGSQPVSGCQMF